MKGAVLSIYLELMIRNRATMKLVIVCFATTARVVDVVFAEHAKLAIGHKA